MLTWLGVNMLKKKKDKNWLTVNVSKLCGCVLQQKFLEFLRRSADKFI